MDSFGALAMIGSDFSIDERFTSLHDEGKPLWEFKEHHWRLYCHRIQSGKTVVIILLNGWKKDKKGRRTAEEKVGNSKGPEVEERVYGINRGETEMTATTWESTSALREELVDVELVQGASLAMAQATIQNAINRRRLSRTDLAKRMGRQRSFVTRMMSGDYNMTIKTFALALAACSYRPTFGFAPVTWTWADENENPTLRITTSVSAGAGTFLFAI